MKTELSIIIVNYNTKHLLKDCLDSVIRNLTATRSEIIVVDNGSQDGSVEMLRREYPAVNLIVNQDNQGFARANNQGIGIADGEHILLLNSDTIVLDGALEKTLRFAKNRKEAGVIGCRILNPDRTLQLSCFRFHNLLTEILTFTKDIIRNFRDPYTDYMNMRFWDHRLIRQVDCLTGCFFWVKKEVFESVGMLDDNFFVYYEDAEFCYRVRKKSIYKVYYFPDADVVHYGGMSVAGEDDRRVQRCYLGAKYYLKKCQGRSAEMMFVFICWALTEFKIMICSALRFNRHFADKLERMKRVYRLCFGEGQPLRGADNIRRKETDDGH
jgi:hypothetical protein